MCQISGLRRNRCREGDGLVWFGMKVQLFPHGTSEVILPFIVTVDPFDFFRSKHFLEIIPREFTISQDLSQKSTPNRFAAVYRYDRAPAIWMAQETVTTLRADHFKTKFPKGFDELGSSD